MHLQRKVGYLDPLGLDSGSYPEDGPELLALRAHSAF